MMWNECDADQGREREKRCLQKSGMQHFNLSPTITVSLFASNRKNKHAQFLYAILVAQLKVNRIFKKKGKRKYLNWTTILETR